MFPEEDFDADEIIREPGDDLEENLEDLEDLEDLDDLHDLHNLLDIPDEEKLN